MNFGFWKYTMDNLFLYDWYLKMHMESPWLGFLPSANIPRPLDVWMGGWLKLCEHSEIFPIIFTCSICDQINGNEGINRQKSGRDFFFLCLRYTYEVWACFWLWVTWCVLLTWPKTIISAKTDTSRGHQAHTWTIQHHLLLQTSSNVVKLLYFSKITTDP